MNLYPPKLACPNLFPDARLVREFALEHGFDGVDWTFSAADFADGLGDEERVRAIAAALHPLEVRGHLFFPKKDIGHSDAGERAQARQLFRRAFRVVSELRPQLITVHVGLGWDSKSELSWFHTSAGLRELVHLGRRLGMAVCVENLPYGWTSSPEVFQALIAQTQSFATLDIGHVHAAALRTGVHRAAEDFVIQQPERVLSAHVYHDERASCGHVPPASPADIEDRLELMLRLPWCDWWVLELREERALLQTLGVVREILTTRATKRGRSVERCCASFPGPMAPRARVGLSARPVGSP